VNTGGSGEVPISLKNQKRKVGKVGTQKKTGLAIKGGKKKSCREQGDRTRWGVSYWIEKNKALKQGTKEKKTKWKHGTGFFSGSNPKGNNLYCSSSRKGGKEAHFVGGEGRGLSRDHKTPTKNNWKEVEKKKRDLGVQIVVKGHPASCQKKDA